MDYLATQKRATRSLTRNGLSYSMIRGGGVENVDGVEIEVPEKPLSVTGVKVDYAPKEIDGTNILSGDIRLVVTAEQDVQIGDRIEVDGIMYRVQKPNPVKPADVIIVYKPQLRA